MQTYVPGASLSSYSPVPGGSMPLRLATWYCSGVRICRHSESVLRTFSLISCLPANFFELRGNDPQSRNLESGHGGPNQNSGGLTFLIRGNKVEHAPAEKKSLAFDGE